ncbi:MAG: tetratricopeptide repeat protein [Verrucomicrobiae bacterium]|nr:tetratricopeptide repeat protein [Verrucomicrobiae bacterium]
MQPRPVPMRNPIRLRIPALFTIIGCLAVTGFPAKGAPGKATENEGSAKSETAPTPSSDDDEIFPGISRKDVEGPDRKKPAKKGQSEIDESVEKALAGMGEPSIDGPLLDPGVVHGLIKQVEPAIVKVTHQSRDGHTLGTGSGFLISADGLVATNQHVIGAARPIKVELLDGREFDVASVHAWDRHLDLAILKIDLGDEKLPFLKIAPPDSIEQGEPILGFGNPQGLKFSVVSGLVSAIRKLDEDLEVEGETPDFPMIQIAMPIEMGNSGGPIVDLEGRVLGIVTIKNVATPNLGFAVPAEHLQPLLDKPNSVPMHRWLTFGALDPAVWTTVMGARWTQRGGIIKGEGLGGGFGGRALCLSERPTPDRPYEIAVNVRLDDESGAAGLAFASDGKDRHYGFYPSGGKIRFTRFEGPDIYSWTILQQIETEAYHPGDWNELRVRVDDEKVTGFVNGTQIMEMDESVLSGGKVGICKFRSTEAEFRHFQSGEHLGEPEVSPATLTRIGKEIDGFSADGKTTGKRLEALAGSPEASRALLLERAEALEARAAAMRKLTEDLHLHEVAAGLATELDTKAPDLFRAGLQIARIDEPDLDFDYYVEQFDRLETEAREAIEKNPDLPPAKDDREKVRRLAKFLFEESGFHGSRSEYYHPGNSYLNEVLEYREGLPITLSVVFIELARRLGIEGVEGIPLPGHFLVGHRDEDAEPSLMLVDVFEGGKIITRREAEDLAWSITRNFPNDTDFKGADAKDICVRMLRNLVGIDMNERRPSEAMSYIELILTISPEESQERFQRALLRYQDENISGAREDFDWLLNRRPPGLDYDRLQQFRDQLEVESGNEEDQ